MRTVVWVGIAIAAGGTLAALYHFKANTQALNAQVTALEQQVERARANLAGLRAEWSFLNQPERLEKLARETLGMAPLRDEQIEQRAGFDRVRSTQSGVGPTRDTDAPAGSARITQGFQEPEPLAPRATTPNAQAPYTREATNGLAASGDAIEIGDRASQSVEPILQQVASTAASLDLNPLNGFEPAVPRAGRRAPADLNRTQAAARTIDQALDKAADQTSDKAAGHASAQRTGQRAAAAARSQVRAIASSAGRGATPSRAQPARVTTAATQFDETAAFQQSPGHVAARDALAAANALLETVETPRVDGAGQ
ncbi:MAG: septum formation initiator family protein [Pseudomonadota bacterium]